MAFISNIKCTCDECGCIDLAQCNDGSCHCDNCKSGQWELHKHSLTTPV